MLNRSM